tara:strand:- start:19426 stop:20553 length:1128 start_codon:yes stop_codon:yes gene_type:complete
MPGFEVYDQREKEAAISVFDGGNVLFSHGFNGLRKNFHVHEFNEMCQNYFETSNAISVSSGTAGLKTALKAAGIKPGDEVITQGFNFIATIESIVDCGAKPIIAPIDEYLNMDLKGTEKLITEKTKAVIIVHMLGYPGDVVRFSSLCDKYNLVLVEDNCEAIGSKIDNRYCGTLGDIGVFSFDHGKMIATGEGGMILTNSGKYADYIKSYIDHGHMNDKNFPRGRDPKRCVGFNYRMTELQGAIGKVQLSKLSKMIFDNKERFQILKNKIGAKYLLRPLIEEAHPTYDTFMFKVSSKELKSKILNAIYSNSFSTKNIPDAMEWHCSYFWEHALSGKMIKDSKSIYEKLNEYIALPILLKLPLAKYNELANLIVSI